jgi:Uma2 family endonuclease
MLTSPQPNYDVKAFLALDEQTFNKRLELHGGHILELESATPNHSVLCNTIGFILRGLYPPSSGCRVFDGSVNIYIDSEEKVVKPDAAVPCGVMQNITGIEGVGAAIQNPVIVVEVLSKDSEKYGKAEKADLYRSLPSLEYYILISQNKMEVQQYSRLGKATWQLVTLTSEEELVRLFKESIRLADLYEGISI